MDNPNAEFPTISAVVEGVIITGKIIYHSQKDMVVEIITPFKDVHRGIHVPWFSTNFLEGERAVSMGLWLLTSTYEICEFAKNNKVVLLERLEITKSEIQKHDEILNSLAQQKVDLKKQ